MPFFRKNQVLKLRYIFGRMIGLQEEIMPYNKWKEKCDICGKFSNEYSGRYNKKNQVEIICDKCKEKEEKQKAEGES